jgi:hypothetical protein
MKLIHFPHFVCSLRRHAKKHAIFIINTSGISGFNVFEYCPRGYIEGRYYFFIRPSTAGSIRVRVLFEGGSYMRKYGSPRLEIKDYLERFPFSKFSKTFGLMVNS